MIAELDRDLDLIHDVHRDVEARLAKMQEAINKPQEQELAKRLAGVDGFWAKRRVRREFLGPIKEQESALLEEVRTLVIPKRIHMEIIEHKKVIDSFDGDLCGCSTGCASPFVRWLKSYCYESYCVTETGTLKTKLSRQTLVRCRQVTFTFALTYLLLCTFYCFLYAVRISDNSVISSVLTSLAIADAAEILVTGPVTLFLSAGIYPWIAMALIVRDVEGFFREEKRKSGLTGADLVALDAEGMESGIALAELDYPMPEQGEIAAGGVWL